MTAQMAKKIYATHSPSAGCMAGGSIHPLGGKTVAEWVREARAGWPRVPVPKDPFAAAQKVAQKHSAVTWEAAR